MPAPSRATMPRCKRWPTVSRWISNRPATWDWPNLRRYVERVGGGFAGLAARAAAGPALADTAPAWATTLGEGLQLAQIVEEVGDDARHGRVYMPIDELQRYEVTAADLMHRRYSPAFSGLMRFQATRARDAACRARHARRDRGRGLPGAAPAHLADADPQAVGSLARRAATLTQARARTLRRPAPTFPFRRAARAAA